MDLSIIKGRRITEILASVHFQYSMQSEINVLFDHIDDYLVIDFKLLDPENPEGPKKIFLSWNSNVQNTKVSSGAKLSRINVPELGIISDYKFSQNEENKREELKFFTENNKVVSFYGFGPVPFNIMEIYHPSDKNRW